MYTVIGIERKVGKFEGRDYDNHVLHCTYKKEGAQGECVVAVKVKTERLEAPVTIGDQVTFLYDQYGNVARCDIK